MDEQKARQILGNRIGVLSHSVIRPDNRLEDWKDYLYWEPGQDKIEIDCRLTIEELEAIVWWMKNH